MSNFGNLSNYINWVSKLTDAQMLVLEVFSSTDNNFSAGEFVDTLLYLVKKRYGPMGDIVLSRMGLNSPEDIGEVVYSLVELDVLTSREDENVLDFYTIINNFSEYFDVSNMEIKHADL